MHIQILKYDPRGRFALGGMAPSESAPAAFLTERFLDGKKQAWIWKCSSCGATSRACFLAKAPEKKFCSICGGDFIPYRFGGKPAKSAIKSNPVSSENEAVSGSSVIKLGRIAYLGCRDFDVRSVFFINRASAHTHSGVMPRQAREGRAVGPALKFERWVI